MPIPFIWAAGLFVAGFGVGGYTFAGFGKNLLILGALGVGVYAYAKAKG